MEDRWIAAWKQPQVEHGKLTKWLWVVWHPEFLKLGNKTDIGAFTCLFAHHGIEIGDCVQIGSHCSIYSLNTEDGTAGKVIIGKGAKIGTHSTIMPGVTVGENAVVGAYSFVKCNVPPGAVALGVPARIRQSK